MQVEIEALQHSQHLFHNKHVKQTREKKASTTQRQEAVCVSAEIDPHVTLNEYFWQEYWQLDSGDYAYSQNVYVQIIKAKLKDANK